MGREVRRVHPRWSHPRTEDYPEEAETHDTHQEWLCCSVDDMVSFATRQNLEWTNATRTHFMMYETTTPGTPLSPAFSQLPDLIRWLVAHQESVWGETPATEEQWWTVCQHISA